MKITYEKWGIHDGKSVYLYTLANNAGARVQVTNYGATLVAVQLADGTHQVLGFDTLQAYLEDRAYMGSTVGPVANRIGAARFTLDGHTYHLEANDGVNNNHSGSAGVHAKVFDKELPEDALVLHYTMPNGDGGFPGNIQLTVYYQWDDNSMLRIRYEAVADKAAVVNITNHAYFNLSGAHGNVQDHVLHIPASQVLETSAAYIPTGKVIPAQSKSFEAPQLLRTGLNDYYILDSKQPLKLAAILEHPASGHSLEVHTTYPGLMVYAADYLASKAAGILGEPYAAFGGVCLECQHYPDAPNHVTFPSITLKAGQRYQEQIIYHFKNTMVR
ncbi:galactose-1-epimerase [Chitinophaga parva]|uniref:Aldose 1-epimerase n=1 Tax=Chitinophaga parva TaxID=2169414 RepID=A0A2T7BE47_9BACT|nr:aldose epimerase family protein [Chitinophaga parva]PUZ23376.1 galactose-1-epimerase [Chitinophaga parva]